ncbi:hypothetical protein JW805_11105 [Roseomonas aeriglobus]|nr:hypothetical protein [Roseomonas aeriglobus]
MAGGEGAVDRRLRHERFADRIERLDSARQLRYISATVKNTEPSTTPSDASQTGQRVRVAMTGLGAVMIFIGLASVVFNYASTEQAVTAVGAAKPDVVANIAETTVSNVAASEPLADLGIAPGPAAPTENSATVK